MITREELAKDGDLCNDKALGCLIGLAVGDAWGDIGRNDAYRQCYGIVTNLYDEAKSTDDTEFALLPACTLLDCQADLTLDAVVHIVNRLATHFDLACYSCSWFTFAYPTHQQNGLRWPEVLSLEHCPTVQIGIVNARTPLYSQSALLGCAELLCLFPVSAAMWAFQLVLVKILQQPSRTQIVI